MLTNSWGALLSPLVLFLSMVLPGWTIYNLVGARHSTFRCRLAIQIALGLLFMAFVGVILSWVGQINSNTLYLAFGTTGVAGVGVWARTHRVANLPIAWSTLRATLNTRSVLAVLPYILAVAIWWSYIGAHTADSGLHAFWSDLIISTGRLPNYALAGPSISPTILVFGPHLLLAEVSMVSQNPVTDSFWVPLVFLYLSILLTIQCITLQITHSETASALASLFYAFSYVPAWRILLGNLSDLTGYFLISVLVLAIITTSDLKSSIITSSLAPSIIVYYQYALLTFIIFAVFLSTFLGFRHVFQHKGVQMTIQKQWRSVIPLVILAIEVLVLASNVSYLNGGSLALLRSTRWPPVSGQEYVSSLGNVTMFFVGTLGVSWMIWSSTKGHVFRSRDAAALASWLIALLAASMGPWIGVGVEPIRFIWHSVEPLAIASGILLACILTAFFGSEDKLAKFARVRIRIRFNSEKGRQRSKALIMALLVTTIVVLPSVVVWPLRQSSEPFFTDDVEIGHWLAGHTNLGSGIAVNSDVDSTATWVQAYSLRPRFFYSANYAIEVSASPYTQVYQDIGVLFSTPNTTQAFAITRMYNISYVVVARPEFSGFSTASHFFVQVYASSLGSVIIFSPKWAAQP